MCMTKKQIKKEALMIAWGILSSVEVTMWDDEDEYTLNDQIRIVQEIHNIGNKLYKKV